MAENEPPGAPQQPSAEIERSNAPPARAKDEPAKAEYYALGCGCLLTILIFGAAMWAGFMRS
jgi:hypothetical protein